MLINVKFLWINSHFATFQMQICHFGMEYTWFTYAHCVLCSHSHVNATCFDVKLKVSPQQGIPNTLGVARANENVYGIFSHLSREWVCLCTYLPWVPDIQNTLYAYQTDYFLSRYYAMLQKNIIATLTISSGA